MGLGGFANGVGVFESTWWVYCAEKLNAYTHLNLKYALATKKKKKKNLKYAFNVNLIKILYVVLNPKITIILELHSFTHHFLQLSYVTDWIVEKKWWVQVIAYSDSNKLLYRRVVVKSVWKSIVLEFL